MLGILILLLTYIILHSRIYNNYKKEVSTMFILKIAEKWYVTYDGTYDGIREEDYVTYDDIREEDYEVFDVSRVMTVSMFREFHGLKMVAFGKNRYYVPQTKPSSESETKRNMDAAIRKHIEFIVRHGWAEVSGDLEDLFRRYAGYDYVIDPEELYEHHIFSDLKPGMDATHYSRPSSQSNPKLIYKAAYGNIRW